MDLRKVLLYYCYTVVILFIGTFVRHFETSVQYVLLLYISDDWFATSIGCCHFISSISHQKLLGQTQHSEELHVVTLCKCTKKFQDIIVQKDTLHENWLKFPSSSFKAFYTLMTYRITPVL